MSFWNIGQKCLNILYFRAMCILVTLWRTNIPSQILNVNVFFYYLLFLFFFHTISINRNSFTNIIKAKIKQLSLPTPGIEPGPRRWERRILTTRPHGRLWLITFSKLQTTIIMYSSVSSSFRQIFIRGELNLSKAQ